MVPDFDIPNDFQPVSARLPAWIDIKQICEDAKRFVAMHVLSNFNSVAINTGKRVFTTEDRSGEFRRHLTSVCPDPSDSADATLVYDCESKRQWVAPRPSAIQFLNAQF